MPTPAKTPPRKSRHVCGQIFSLLCFPFLASIPWKFVSTAYSLLVTFSAWYKQLKTTYILCAVRVWRMPFSCNSNESDVGDIACDVCPRLHVVVECVDCVDLESSAKLLALLSCQCQGITEDIYGSWRRSMVITGKALVSLFSPFKHDGHRQTVI